jgi:hypothetical protein
MGYLLESKLSSVVDIPVALPATEIKQDDWLLVGSTKIVAPMVLTVRYLSLQVLSCSVEISRISSVNRVYGNLGLVFLALRRDYVSGNPGAAGAIESLIATDLGIFNRDISVPLVLSTPGVYSWLLVNNMKPDSASSVATTTSIDFRVCLTGQARLDFGNA